MLEENLNFPQLQNMLWRNVQQNGTTDRNPPASRKWLTRCSRHKRQYHLASEKSPGLLSASNRGPNQKPWAEIRSWMVTRSYPGQNVAQKDFDHPFVKLCFMGSPYNLRLWRHIPGLAMAPVQASTNRHSKGFQHSWFGSFADAIVLDVEGSLLFGHVHIGYDTFDTCFLFTSFGWDSKTKIPGSWCFSLTWMFRPLDICLSFPMGTWTSSGSGCSQDSKKIPSQVAAYHPTCVTGTE